MINDYLSAARDAAAELTELRHAIHRHPELGNGERETSARVEAFLQALGLEVERPFGTAVVGRLRGAKPGTAVALRADMDALPIREETGAAFASEIPGVMHACGHDVHTAALLGAAKLLAARRQTLPGTVVFLFQPDEEGDGGARRLIEAGAIDGVDAVFGGHVSPEYPAGHIAVRYGKFYAAADMFDIVVRGKSAHGAEREKGIDALGAAAAVVGALLALPERLPGERSVVTVGSFHAGTARNILADRAELSGILRTLGQDTRETMRAWLRSAVEDAVRPFGASADLNLRAGYPGVVNHDDMTLLAQDAAAALLGADRVHTIAGPTMTTEDFGCFLLERPGSFYHIGAGCPLPLHSAGFLPDDAAVVTAAAVHAAVAETYLRTYSDPKGHSHGHDHC